MKSESDRREEYNSTDGTCEGDSMPSDEDIKNAFKDALSVTLDLLQPKPLTSKGIKAAQVANMTISAFPFSVTRSTSMEHIYVLFEMVKLLQIYVLDDGRLSGVITRTQLLDRLKATDNH